MIENKFDKSNLNIKEILLEKVELFTKIKDDLIMIQKDKSKNVEVYRIKDMIKMNEFSTDGLQVNCSIHIGNCMILGCDRRIIMINSKTFTYAGNIETKTKVCSFM